MELDPKLVVEAKKLKTNYSTYAMIAAVAMGYIAQTQSTSLQAMMDNFSWPALVQWLIGLGVMLVARVLPQVDSQELDYDQKDSH